RRFSFTPYHQYKSINEKSHQDIHDHTAQHDDEPLPCGFASEFPFLWWQLHRFLVHAFVNHTRYFHISAQRQPTDAVNSFSDFFLYERKPGVKKEKKLFNPAAKPTGSYIMSKLM